MPPLAAGLLALAVLALLPGVLVVRAPWTAVPALSFSFWAVTAWWHPGTGRGRVVSVALLVFGLLALLRLLPKHEVPPPPGWAPGLAAPRPARPGLPPPRLATAPSLLVIAVALALLAPMPLWHHAPGPRLAFQTTMARLLLWRDGIPATGDPLLPLAPVGAHAPAIASLAADVSTLSGLAPAGAVLLVIVAAAGLLLVGLFALHGTWAPPRVAALGAVIGLAAAPWPGLLRPWGEGEALVALAFALPAAALLVGHASRSSAVAAGLLLAASALAQPLLAAIALVGCTIAARQSPGESRSRVPLSGVLALALAAPGLQPLARSLSLREAVAIASGMPSADLLPFGLGLGVVAFAPLALGRLAAPRSSRATVAALALVGGALLVVRVHGWIATGQLPAPVWAGLLRAGAETGPLDVLCAPEPARDWVPAIAGRTAGELGPWIPAVYADEWAARPRRPCGARLEAFLPDR